MATHSSTFAWKNLWTKEPCRLQSMGSQRVGHDRATSLHFSPCSCLPPGPAWSFTLIIIQHPLILLLPEPRWSLFQTTSIPSSGSNQTAIGISLSPMLKQGGEFKRNDCTLDLLLATSCHFQPYFTLSPSCLRSEYLSFTTEARCMTQDQITSKMPGPFLFHLSCELYKGGKW